MGVIRVTRARAGTRRAGPAGRRARGRRAAFTLVELLVVVGIVALLIGILLPVISRARAHAQFVACQAQLRTQVQAILAYAINHRDAKPPLYQRRPLTVRLDWVSPDLKWNNQPVGLGLLVDGGYLTHDALMDPSADMAEDVRRDRENWALLPTSGCSYAYYWRHPDTAPADPRLACTGATVQQERTRKRTAVVMDLNAESGHAYLGEYEGRAWVSHGRIGRLNVGFLDGAVLAFPVEDVLLKFPGGVLEELDWFEAAHSMAR
jgi:type II secretory pathway pseudopilin PulG